MSEVPVVLFLCTHNAGRSLAARVLLDHYAEGRIDVRSAGSEPPPSSTRRLSHCFSSGVSTRDGSSRSRSPTRWPGKPTSSSRWAAATRVPVYPGKRFVDWELDDPAGQPVERGRPIVDDIDHRVQALMEELLTDSSP